jgi:hypothetical protein
MKMQLAKIRKQCQDLSDEAHELGELVGRADRLPRFNVMALGMAVEMLFGKVDEMKTNLAAVIAQREQTS